MSLDIELKRINAYINIIVVSKGNVGYRGNYSIVERLGDLVECIVEYILEDANNIKYKLKLTFLKKRVTFPLYLF